MVIDITRKARETMRILRNQVHGYIWFLGPTHHATEDIGIMRTLPGRTDLPQRSGATAGIAVRMETTSP